MSNIVKYRKGYKYQLAEDYIIQIVIIPTKDIVTEFLNLNVSGLLIIRRGYAWDGASGLTFDTKSSIRGSLVHDALYQLLREELLSQHYRKRADEYLRDVCIEDKMWKWRANGWYKAVRKFAMSAANPENEKQILTAP